MTTPISHAIRTGTMTTSCLTKLGTDSSSIASRWPVSALVNHAPECDATSRWTTRPAAV